MTYKQIYDIMTMVDELSLKRYDVDAYIQKRNELKAFLEQIHDEHFGVELELTELRAAEDTRKMLKKGLANSLYGIRAFDQIPDDADKFSEQDLPFPDVEGGEE